MRRFLVLQLTLLLALSALADPAFSTKDVPINRGGKDDGMVSLRFYEDMPSVAYISVADFQQLMLPGTTITVTKKGEGEYTLKGPYAEATVSTTTEQFSSDDYLGFTNLMGLIQPGMDNVYLDGAPFIRYRSQELTPASATVTFDFKKYGIDLRGDDSTVFFPFVTLSDLYSDLYYHIAAYNGEKVIIVTENQNSSIAKMEPESAVRLLMAESRSADMAAYSYGELCFTIDHFYGMPGRSPLEDAIRKDGLDKALDSANNGTTIKKLLKSTNMKEYIFGLNCLQLLLEDGGHTTMMADLLIYQALEENEGDGGMTWINAVNQMKNSYPELTTALMNYAQSMANQKEEIIEILRPINDTYYKKGDTAYLMLNTFGPTNNHAWNTYYNGGCTGATPAIADDFMGDLSVVLDALKRASDDPEVKNLVIDLSINHGGSLDVVMAMTALMGGQSHFYSENVLTGQRQKIYYDVDCNFDGKFDEKDKEVKYNLNYAVLTTDVAFSCGNLFPSLMKDMGFLIIGEKSGGGACAVQNFVTGEGFQYQLSSSRARLTNDKWQNIDGGVEPTYVINTEDEGYSGFYDLAAISDIINKNNSGNVQGDMANITAKGIFTDGDVTLSVTKTGADSYSLYDSERNITVLSGAEFMPLDSLAMQGRFYDYFAHNDLYKDNVDLYIEDIIKGNDDSDSRIDISNYLKMGSTVTSKDAFHDYRLKSITISRLTANGKDYMPSASAPLTLLRTAISHGKNRWSSVFDYTIPRLTDSPIILSSDELYNQWRVIPAEGAILKLFAIRGQDGVDPESEEDFWSTADIATFNVPFVPNESGITEIDQNGLKATITYERSASPNVDIYRNLTRTYDFYKKVFGRNSYDGKGAPLYSMTYLPGGEMGIIDMDGKMPKYLFYTEQVGAYAKSTYNPAVIICSTGGKLTDMVNPEKGKYLLPMVEPSVITHEFTHLVTKNTSNLSSNLLSEGGALNESFSDIMAISMMKTADYGYGPETPWVIGGHGLVLGKSCLRNMANPKQSLDGDDHQPDTYEGQYWNPENKYSMMGVQNKFYYLLCEGGKGTNDNGTDYDMTGIGIEKGMQIAYLTLTKYCSRESDYSNIRDSWLKAAQELYGDGTETQAVANAWTAVGINSTLPVGIETPFFSSTQGEHSPAWFTIDGRRLDAQPSQKGVYIYNGKKIVR